jgi:hypothetical protein
MHSVGLQGKFEVIRTIRACLKTATARPWTLPAALFHLRNAKSKFHQESFVHPANAQNTWTNACAWLWSNFDHAGELPW